MVQLCDIHSIGSCVVSTSFYSGVWPVPLVCVAMCIYAHVIGLIPSLLYLGMYMYATLALVMCKVSFAAKVIAAFSRSK